MDHQEREKKLHLISRLLRVRCCITDMKNERMVPASLHKLQIAFIDMGRLREVVSDIKDMEERNAKGPHELLKRYHNLYLKNFLIEKIESAIVFLESQTNLLSTRSCVLSILDDLERATLIFRMRAMNYVVALPEKSEKSVVEETPAETVEEKRADTVEKTQAKTIAEKQTDIFHEKPAEE